MAKLSPLMILPPAIFAGLAVVFYVGMFREDPDALPSAMAGKPAPDMALTQLGNEPPFDNEALRAPGVKLVNYWASGCSTRQGAHQLAQ